MQDKMSNAIENNEYSIGKFFDLAKAFDTVNHIYTGSKVLNSNGLLATLWTSPK